MLQGEKEARAWTIFKGTKAPQAAAQIHSDMERGFIRAEVTSYDDFVAENGWAGVRSKGKARLEGKEYVMNDGDVRLCFKALLGAFHFLESSAYGPDASCVHVSAPQVVEFKFNV